nr:MAG TPA: Protein of unknown function (DUF722) [Caudoviricetes sp.]
MRWDVEAIAKLREYTVRKAALDNLPAEIERLEQEYGRIRSATTDGTPVRGGGNAREDMLLSNICLREELKLRLADTQEWIATMDNALAALTDEERLVLDRFYINPHKGSIDRLCGELNMELAGVYKRKGKALRRLTIILYGCVES